MKALAAALLCLTLTSCATMVDTADAFAHMGVVSEEVSTFDGATIVAVSPTWLYNAETDTYNAYKLGGRWNSSQPDYVSLVIRFEASGRYVVFEGVKLRIGDTVVESRAGRTHPESSYDAFIDNIDTTSTASVGITLDTLDRLLAAPDARIRIMSSSGYEDSTFAIDRTPHGQRTARAALKEFRAAVAAKRAELPSE